MSEYKYILLEDDQDPTASVLTTVVDKLEPIPKKYIAKISRKGDSLQVTWNTWKPTAADRPAFQEKMAKLAETQSYENLMSPRFVLPPSLEAALAMIRSGRITCSLEDLDQLHLWGLADVDYDFDYISTDFKSLTEGVVYFKKSLANATLTEKGSTYLNQGFLESLR